MQPPNMPDVEELIKRLRGRWTPGSGGMGGAGGFRGIGLFAFGVAAVVTGISSLVNVDR